MARITNVSETKGYDNETGEVTYSEETHTMNIPSEPEFVKLYLNDILYLSDLPRGLNPILLSFLKRMNYGNELVINAALKRIIAKEVNLSVSSVNNAITGFVKGNIFERVDTGMYLVNALLFGKGQWKDIARLRLNITYDIDGKTFNTEVKKSKDKENNKVRNLLRDDDKKEENLSDLEMN